MWSKLETDHLIGLALKYDLRWPVIKDRYKCTPDRPVQDLQHRFYDVANRLQVFVCACVCYYVFSQSVCVTMYFPGVLSKNYISSIALTLSITPTG